MSGDHDPVEALREEVAFCEAYELTYIACPVPAGSVRALLARVEELTRERDEARAEVARMVERMDSGGYVQGRIKQAEDARACELHAKMQRDAARAEADTLRRDLAHIGLMVQAEGLDTRFVGPRQALEWVRNRVNEALGLTPDSADPRSEAGEVNDVDA